MTARQVYEAVLVEMNKVQAPSLLLEDFNYLFNKAINQYINKKYNIYDTSQQTTDDLRVLKSSVTLRANNDNDVVNDVTARDSIYGAIYEFALPADYLHLLNCICNFKVNKPFKCYNANTYVQFPAIRLTSDMWSQIINNFYMRPSYKRPYYFIHNVNITSNEKVNYNGNSGRIPSDNIYIPTDSGNTDVINLKGSNQTDSFGYNYIDENNYDKQGINRYTEFSDGFVAIPVVQAIGSPRYNPPSTGDWRRTGEGKLYGGDNGGREYVLGNLTATIVQENGAPVKYEWTSNTASDINGNITFTKVGNVAIPDSFINDHKTEFKKNTGEIQSVSNITYGANVITSVYWKWQWQEYETLYRREQNKFNSVEKVGEVRYGNPSQVRLEIRYGKDKSLFTLDSVYVDYIKSPQYIRITQEQLDLTEDTSQIMEFPDYVIQEIINELVHIVMENASDPRLQTHIPISQSIANPAQQQEASK